MAPVKIKDIVSFTSQDQKNCVENLCGTGEGRRPWLCSPQDRSGVLKVELQMERATAIGYIDVGNCGSAFIQIDVGRSSWPLERPYVTLLPTATLMSPADSKQQKGRTGVRMFKRGDFLPAGVDELWDRVRVTCSQPFSRRAQFGLSFLRLRSPEGEGGAAGEQGAEGGQRTPEQQTSRVREWLSSPAVQRTFFGRGGEGGSPGRDRLAGASEGSGREGAGLSRAARMVITAAQSGRRSLLPSPASPPNPASPSSVQRRPTAVRPDTEGEASVNPKKARRPVKRKPVSRKRPQAPCWKKTKPAACEQSLSGSPPCSTAPPGASEDPETCCPLCGGYFSPEYLPQHASSCQGEEPDVELSFTPPYSPAHSTGGPAHSTGGPAHSTGGPAHSPALYAEQDLVPCPLCSFRFPSSQIHLHASSCGDPLEPQWSWVD